MLPADADDLLAAQRRLRARFDDFLQALDRRDRAAQSIALRDFEGHLRRWTRREMEVLLPLLEEVGVPGRDPVRELRLEYVQLRELTRYLLELVSGNAAMADILGLVESRLRAGALVVADNADDSPDYLARVRSPANGYLSTPFAEDVELSMRIG